MPSQSNTILNPKDNEVNKINSIISLLFSPNQMLRDNNNVIDENTEQSSVKLIELSKCLKLSILKFIEDEYQVREQRRRQLIKIGLPLRGNDNNTINRLFRTLRQPSPKNFKCLNSNVNSKHKSTPIVCEFYHENEVHKLLKNVYRLKQTTGFEKVYINPHRAANERILNSISRQKKKFILDGGQKVANEAVADQKKIIINQTSSNSCTSQSAAKLNPSTSSANLNSTVPKFYQNLNQPAPKIKNPIDYKIKVYSSQTIDLTEESINMKNDDPKIVKALGIDFLKSDLNALTSGFKLKERILNYYLNFLCNSFGKKKFVTVDSILIQKILSADHRGISKCFDKYIQSNFQIFYFPLHLDNNHWALLVFDARTKQVIYFDSLYAITKNVLIIKNFVSILSKYISVLKDSPTWELYQNQLAPKQSGEIDCGVFVYQYAKYFGQNQSFDFNQVDISNKRTEMANEILSFESTQILLITDKQPVFLKRIFRNT
ncbi:unnamed protein product [Brachionus calyciflorus]|uniref:Ubiquitin-like protease family profile domain-containing protein n=1 Tax=Brachionus calyciflorus TaxID=104777 RepID=A0A813WTI0_9BILA|nr:unnamed protein product [Brachionus calyciflorus]